MGNTKTLCTAHIAMKDGKTESPDRMTTQSHKEFGPWNPGLVSQLPREFLPLSTVLREENVVTPLSQAQELSDFSGLQLHEVARFSTERLIIHELLVRITADLSVRDGAKYADLGINFREIAQTILDRYIAPHQGQLESLMQAATKAARLTIRHAIEEAAPAAPATKAHDKTRWERIAERFFGASPKADQRPIMNAQERDRATVKRCRQRIDQASDESARAANKAIADALSAILARQGRLPGDMSIAEEIAITLFVNGQGSRIVGEAIEPMIAEAAKAEGYTFLPIQDKPVVMNVKGASASGKSTLRPLQKRLAQRLNVPWTDFALISPDIWRKFLLDYDSLGAAYKYAGMLTGHEVEIIDAKLDAYMSQKAAAGRMSHLLIDRFRFDSFKPAAEVEKAGRLLTRFGDLVYMYFVITPPEATVERAWKRGLEFGRFKAVDDLLHHNVEAFTGMPELFFTWALRNNMRVHCEFLDNSVALGERPRTVAFGWNGEINILDVGAFLNVDRFRKINIDAANPDGVYAEDMAPEANVEFLRHCVRMIPVLNFADHQSGEVFARLKQGTWDWVDHARVAALTRDDPALAAGLAAIGGISAAPDKPSDARPDRLDADDPNTLGAWGPQSQSH